MELPRSMTSQYRWLLIRLFPLVITACASPDSDSAPTSGTATLSWDASAGPDLEGYKIYQATASGGYGAPIATVTMDFTSYTVTSLEASTTHFFAVTAYNSDGAESSFSNEVSKTIR
ncbi:MAG: fibronectin type III domain-containing protein [Nitrospira sp.]|nr:fibronectin type III domain-containing protein [Nitrospira sp.]